MQGLSTDLLLRAYACGLFPMAESKDSQVLFWVDPPMRGILPLEGLHVPRSLRKVIRQGRFTVRYDSAFIDLMRLCAEPAEDRPDTWINEQILRLYEELFWRGHAHSVECWQGETLVGGLYGVSLGGAFFGESMVTRVRDASKVALVHLVAQLRASGFTLLDTQFSTDHLAQFGVVEVPQADYKRDLAQALRVRTQFRTAPNAVEELFASIDARPKNPKDAATGRAAGTS